MGACAICEQAIDGPALTDDDARTAVHPACAVAALPRDLAVLLAEALALVALPTILLMTA